MKKIITIVSVVLVISLVIIIFIPKEKAKPSYKTILKNYSLYQDKDRYFNIDIYGNDSINLLNSDSKFYLAGKRKYSLNDFDIKEIKKDDYNIYRINICYDNLSFYKEDVNLIIMNEEYKLVCNIGSVTIYTDEYKLLEFSDLYGNYGVFNDGLYLAGITISLDNKYDVLDEVECGILKGDLLNVENTSKNVEIGEYSFIKTYIDSSYKLIKNNSYYFIPLCYKDLLFMDIGCLIFDIDGEKYLLDNFTYFIKDIDLSDYSDILKEGNLCLN